MVGEEGQRRLRDSHALIVGCGALGAAAADLLCRAGVGTITLVDRDFVELTNLQRQTLYEERDALDAAPKAEAARRRLERIDPATRVRAMVDDFGPFTAEQMAAGADVIIDGTDNFETRYLINDLAVSTGRPWVYAGVVGVTGMQMTVLPRAQTGSKAAPWSGHETACLRCVFPEAPPPGTTPTCDTAGVLGPAVALVAGFQATEAIKALLGRWPDVRRTLVSFDAWTGDVRAIDVSAAARDDCPCCGLRSFDHLSGDAASQATTLCGRGSVQILPPPDRPDLDLVALAARLTPHGAFSLTPIMLRGRLASERGDGGQPIELTVFSNARAIIGNVTSPEQARAIYARYVGA